MKPINVSVREFWFLREMMKLGGVGAVADFRGTWKSYNTGRVGCRRKGLITIDRNGYYRVTELGRMAYDKLKHEFQESAPAVAAPHNTGERDPSVMADCAGAETAKNG